MRIVSLMILIFLSTLLFSSEFEITSKINENPGHMGLQMQDDSKKYDINDELCALLIVRCGIVDINFSNSASKEGQIDKAGEYWITMKQGASYIVLKKDGFGNFKENFGFKLRSGSVYEMSVDQKYGNESNVTVVITTNQNGIEVFSDGDDLGKTENNMLTAKLAVGKHIIKLAKAGFATIEEELILTEDDYTFDYNLFPTMPSAVTIKTVPNGATIYINNIKFGTSPKSSFFEAGTYPIKIEKKSYETIEEQITITEPETKKTYDMTDIRATLTVNTHKDATVYFDGKSYKGGIDKLILLPQMISLKVEQEYCEPINKTYTLLNGENKTYDLFPSDTSARLTINTHANATVKFNGQKFKGGIRNHKITPQVLEIEVTMLKAKTQNMVITLNPKDEVTREIYPEVATGTIQVMTIPTNAKIELTDDSGEHFTAIGRKTFMDVPVGSYELVVKAEDYKTHNEEFRLIADETVPKQITLEEGGDTLFFDDFDDNDYLNSQTWKLSNEDDKPGMIIMDKGYVKFKRENAGGNGGSILLSKDINITVESSTKIKFDVKPVFSDVGSGAGWDDTEYPIFIQLHLENSYGKVSILKFAYNYRGGKSKNFKNIVQVTFPFYNKNEWIKNEEFIITKFVPKARKIRKLTIGGNGWNFIGCIDNLEISN